jgi:hypothetical protein
MFDIVRNLRDDLPSGGRTYTDELLSADGGFFYKPVTKFTFGTLKKYDVKRAYSRAVREFYIRPKKMLGILKTIKSWNELKWLGNFLLVAAINMLSLNADAG